ncbi:MAG: hypothetical protein DRI61_04850 [Chloroflexi bacterium]|nr:MAG: hypothetical protein DRI61_04850 [Chloroflexota bacterium]
MGIKNDIWDLGYTIEDKVLVGFIDRVNEGEYGAEIITEALANNYTPEQIGIYVDCSYADVHGNNHGIGNSEDGK